MKMRETLHLVYLKEPPTLDRMNWTVLSATALAIVALGSAQEWGGGGMGGGPGDMQGGGMPGPDMQGGGMDGGMQGGPGMMGGPGDMGGYGKRARHQHALSLCLLRAG